MASSDAAHSAWQAHLEKEKAPTNDRPNFLLPLILGTIDLPPKAADFNLKTRRHPVKNPHQIPEELVNSRSPKWE
jgi:hypothetical protein